ncbi:hypothetical protein [Streptomyces sp. KL116D]|uniref:hypothetical protein n=1 Tax=Streptomyces sp. KL116D TaxID=3045152 RepID=UPI00355665B3
MGDAAARAASPRSDTVGRRLAVLRRLAHPSTDDPETGPVSVVVAPVRSVLQPQVQGARRPGARRAAHRAERRSERDGRGARRGRVRPRRTRREARRKFAVRGGILDVLPPTEEHPLRVEFWGDDVEEIRYFKVAGPAVPGDRRARPVGATCRELLLTADVRARAAAPRRTAP